MREATKEQIERIVLNLRAGMSPKEIAVRLGVGWECVKAIINRHRSVRTIYVETHPLRYPKRESPPLKIVSPLDNCNVNSM